MRQASAIVLALGLSQYFLRPGSFMYPHMHGCCSFSLLQQSDVGVGGPMNAGRHGLSSFASQITAVAIGAATRATSAAAARIAVNDGDFVICNYYRERDAERERESWERIGKRGRRGGIYRGSRIGVAGMVCLGSRDSRGGRCLKTAGIHGAVTGADR